MSVNYPTCKAYVIFGMSKKRGGWGAGTVLYRQLEACQQHRILSLLKLAAPSKKKQYLRKEEGDAGEGYVLKRAWGRVETFSIICS